MTTITLPSKAGTSRPPAGRTSLGRLTRIELRKAVDTRSGRWLLVVIGAVGLVGLAIAVFAGGAKDHTFHDGASTIEGLTSIFMPVITILLITSEWSQRSALQTFTLTPRRSRVIAAKLLAGSALAVGVAIFGLVLAALGTAAAGSHPAHGEWTHAGTVILGSVIMQLLTALTGMAFGLLLLSSAAAIVVNFVVPVAWGTLASTIHALHGVRPWLDPSDISDHLTDGTMTGHRWEELAVITLIWVVALLVGGLVKLSRKEIAG